MGSPIYDFLTESLLFDDSLIEENFESASDGELRSELQNYREFCLTSLSELETEATADSNSLHVFAGVDGPDLSLLKRGALYFNRFIVSDPLFPLTRESTEADRATNKAMGLRAGDLDRRRLTVVVRELKTLTPMVAANYVKILPASFALEPPPVIPYRFSRTGFSDVLPPQLLELLQRDAIVQSGRKTEDGWHSTALPFRPV